ncbi:MAG: extracellular solute-binding protein [bacterium]
MSKNKIIIIAVIAVIVVIIGGIFLFGTKSDPLKKTELEFWGVFDDSDVYSSLIADFNKVFPNIKINYYKKSYADYEKDILQAMATGRGPDIFAMHHTWFPRYADKIWAAPSEIISVKEVQDEFVDVVAIDFIVDGIVVALPLSMDTLALYYNKDIFNSAGIPEPPETWEEFLDDVEKITIKDEQGNIIRAGASIGTARNVNRSTDIFSLLMLQSGTKIVSPDKDKAIFNESVSINGESFYPGQRALQFYTDFASPLKSIYTWNNRMHYSIDSFYEGKTAMMFNYSYHLSTIRAKSPYLNFAVAPMPQIKDSAQDINYANYWGLTVSRNCDDPNEAWQFIKWLSQKENTQKYLELSGTPTARRDIIFSQKNDPDLGVFAEQALTARSWYQVDNFAIETILADMVESVVLGQSAIKQAIDKATNQVSLLMK